MPSFGPKDTIALCPIPYDRGKYFTRDATMKTITLKPDVEFDHNDAMLFYFKDMYENSCIASTSEYNKERHIRSYMRGANHASNRDLQIQ